MSFHGNPSGGYGYGGMQMPMPFGGPNTNQSNSSYSSSTPYPTLTTSTGYQNQTQLQNQSQSSGEIERWMDELIKNLTDLIKAAPRSELEQLVNNEMTLVELVQDAEQTKKLQRKREELVEGNKDQAVTNLSLEPELAVLKNSLMELAEEQNNLQEKQMQLQQNLSSKVSIDTILAVLQASAAEKETESDKLSHDFVSGSKAVDEFIEQYIPERKIYQLRKVKSEKMTQLLQTGAININRQGSTNRPQPMPRHMSGQTGYRGYGGY